MRNSTRSTDPADAPIGIGFIISFPTIAVAVVLGVTINLLGTSNPMSLGLTADRATHSPTLSGEFVVRASPGSAEAAGLIPVEELGLAGRS